MDNANELASFIQQIAAQQSGAKKYAVFGNIASYNPQSHSVRCVVPAFRDASGTPILSPELPLGTLWVGDDFGIQIAPFGGATFANPEQGEPCVISLVEQTFGAAVVVSLFYGGTLVPPNTLIQAGECVIRHKSGSELYFNSDGDVLVISDRDINATVGRDANLTVNRNLTATISGDATVNVTGSATIDAATITLAGGGPQVARVGDSTICPAGVGHITSGSPKVNSG